jgi:hypothetical protein
MNAGTDDLWVKALGEDKVEDMDDRWMKGRTT